MSRSVRAIAIVKVLHPRPEVRSCFTEAEACAVMDLFGLDDIWYIDQGHPGGIGDTQAVRHGRRTTVAMAPARTKWGKR